MPTLRTLVKHIGILFARLRTQGLRVTLIWLYGRGFPRLTGLPLLRYSQVTPAVFVGPQYRQNGKELLERAGIDSGVNLRVEFDDAAHGLVLAHYCYLPTVDDEAPSLEHLAQGVVFIRERVSAGGKVYIHCGGGIGRAATMAAAYFVAEGRTPSEALDLIRKVRPFIRPTPPQLAQLERFAQTVTQK